MNKSHKVYYEVRYESGGVMISYPDLFDAIVYFLMELNNYGGDYQVFKIESSTDFENNTRIVTKKETIMDMTDEIEKYINKMGDLRSGHKWEMATW